MGIWEASVRVRDGSLRSNRYLSKDRAVRIPGALPIGIQCPCPCTASLHASEAGLWCHHRACLMLTDTMPMHQLWPYMKACGTQ